MNDNKAQATEPGLVGALRVSGSDAATFLQSLLTSDLLRLKPGMGQLSCWCSAQGRVLADFYLWRLESDFLLLPPPQMLDFLHRRLSAYVLRAKVRITTLSDYTWSAWVGTADHSADDSCLEALSIPSYTGLEQNEKYWLRVPGAAARFLYGAPSGSTLPEKAGNPLQTLSLEQWAHLDIAAGLPWIGPASSDLFLPQMLNLEQLGALHLDKGCFPGQEVISRLHYRGKLKRRLYRVYSETALPVGLELLDQEKQLAGLVLNSVAVDQGGISLAVVKIAAAGLGLTGKTGAGAGETGAGALRLESAAPPPAGTASRSP